MPSLVLANLVAIGLLVGLTGFMLARRPSRLLWPWILLFQLCLIVFAIGDAITKTATHMTAEQIGAVLLYSGSFLGIGCWWMVTLRFAELQGFPLRLARPRFLWPVLGFATAAWLFAATNPWHEQFLVPVISGRYHHQPAWWVLGVGGHLLAAGTIGIYTWLIIRAGSRRNRSNAVVMLLAVAVPGIVNLAYTANHEWFSDPTSLALCVSSGLFVWGTYRTGLFSLTPFALETVLRHDPTAVLVTDGRGQLLFANPAAEQLLGKRVTLLRNSVFAALARRLHYVESDRQMAGDEFRELFVRSGFEDRRLLFRDDSGRWLDVEVNAIPHRWGTDAALALHLRDITEQRRAEAEHLEYERRMYKAQRLESIGVLASGVAHDFNNLLTAILVNAELGLGSVDGDSSAGNCLREICSVSRHAAEFVDQLVAYAGQQSHKREPIDCGAIAREMKTLLVGVVGKTVQLELQLQPGLPSVSADPVQLRQVMMNLLINAADAQQGRDGAIGLEIDTCVVKAAEMSRWALGAQRPAGRYVFIRVRDRGQGMDDVTMARILEPFFSTKEAARGLGLASAVGIIRAHEGGLLIESAVNVGSTFTVYLPALDAKAGSTGRETDPGPAEEASVAIDGNRRTVLLVDDEDAVRSGARRALEASGFVVLAADGGREALRLIERHTSTIAVVLLDACMPGMSGRATLEQIRRAGFDVPVVVTSGHQEGARLFEESRDRGVVAFLPKPFSSRQVVEVVSGALKGAAATAAPRSMS